MLQSKLCAKSNIQGGFPLNNNVIFGKYIPKNSVVHKLNTVIKLLIFTVLLTISFSIQKIQPFIFIILFLSLMIYLSKIPLKIYIKSTIFFILFSFIIATTNLFFSHYFLTFQPNSSNTFVQNFSTSLLIFLKLSLLALANSVLIFTTPPNRISHALEIIFSPLKIFRINTRQFALITSISLRFIPIIFGETNKIITAQKCRGADFQNKNLLKRIKNFSTVAIPLTFSLVKKAKILSDSIISRGYDLEKPRTQFKKFIIQKCDIMFSIVFILTIFGVIICNKTIL